jgi:hypothetical protein
MESNSSVSNTNHRQQLIAPFLAVLIALAIAACSSDTRAILAPTDGSLSVVPGAPLVVVNEGVELTIHATKSDGSPVADGTEILLTASSGEFDSPKVRTTGGQATAFYRAASTGPVEISASSDVIQAQLILAAASAAVARIEVTTSPTELPETGGEVEVKATVFGPSGERVTGAPVEFLASSGTIAGAAAGTPTFTDEQGQATIRLSTTQASQVRARVHTVESNTLDIVLERPRLRGDQRDLPFRMSDVIWLHENVSEWEVTSEVTGVMIDHDTICIEHTKAGKWPRRGIGEGNPWVVANVDGQWYAATYEYLRSGQTCKHITRRGEWGIGPHTKRHPLESWAPRKGELVGFFVSTFARDSTRTSNERSNIQMVEWPY